MSSVSSLTSASSNSASSTLGMISSGLVRESRRPSDCESEVENILGSKLGVAKGDSLAEDMEGGGDELVLKRVCAPDGGGPKGIVKFIRSDSEATSSAISGDKATLDARIVCMRRVYWKLRVGSTAPRLIFAQQSAILQCLKSLHHSC